MRSLGVTGTNGKTSTVTWAAAALSTLRAPVLWRTTVGFWLGDEPLTAGPGFQGFVQAAEGAAARGASLAAIEMTSQALGQGMARAWPCEVAVFTNFTRDHLDAHGTAEHYLASKAQLFAALPPGGTAVLNACDPAYPLLREIVPSHARAVTYGSPTRGPALAPLDCRVEVTEVSGSGTRVAVTGPALGDRGLLVRAVGAHFAENAVAALLGAIAMGAPLEAAIQSVAEAAPPPGRFEVVSRAPFVVIDYAHTPDALARTCETARALGSGKLTVVFGAGGDRDREKRGPMGQAARSADRVVLTSDNPRGEDPAEIAASLHRGLAGHRDVRVELDRALAIAQAIAEAGDDDVVLVCGKGHETTQTAGDLTIHLSDHEGAKLALQSRLKAKERPH